MRQGTGDRGQGTEKRRARGYGLWTTDYGLFSIVLLLSLTGCSVLTHIKQPFRLSGERVKPAEFLEDGYEDYVGVLHIHTTYSHDAMGTFEEAVRVANAQRLNYIAITEHNTLQPLREGKQGWHGMTLVLIGMEISTRSGHYLTLNVTEDIDRSKLTTQQIIDEVNRQGGLGFIAHPYFKHGRWRDWTVTGFTGIEGYNVAHDTLDENRWQLVLRSLTDSAEPFYLSILDRPDEPLAKWDALIRERGQVVGIGSSDAHEIHVLGLTFAPYEVMFRISRTHVLIPSKTLDAQGIYEALRKGHAYFSIELVAEAKGFSFIAENGHEVLGIMGDAAPLVPNLRLSVILPAAAQLTLVRDGKPIATKTGQTWQIPVTEPGAYRLEAMRYNKPWIFSNPIYVRPFQPVAERMPQIAPQQPTEKAQTATTSAASNQPAGSPGQPTSSSPVAGEPSSEQQGSAAPPSPTPPTPPPDRASESPAHAESHDASPAQSASESIAQPTGSPTQ